MTRTDRTKASEGSENALTLSPSEGKRNLSQLAFTVAEVAGIFSVSKRQVQYWIASGELRHELHSLPHIHVVGEDVVSKRGFDLGMSCNG